MTETFSSKTEWLDFDNELSDIKNLIWEMEQDVSINEPTFINELKSLNQEINEFEWNNENNTIEKFENMVNSLLEKINEIEKEFNINCDKYEEELWFILSSRKELKLLSSSVNNSLNTESWREKLAEIWKEEAANSVYADINELSQKNPIFNFFKNKV